MLEYLAVMKLRQKNDKGKNGKKKQADGNINILCFIGPPGVGKTSIGKSIARASVMKLKLGATAELMLALCREELFRGLKTPGPKIQFLCWMRLIK